ncbi:LPXTG cell wall anchor domain-containing protein [Dielma fastidiosa]|nr:LPXTG cell wall anchor domain-containing protein [Dielma fastidiosa]
MLLQAIQNYSSSVIDFYGFDSFTFWFGIVIVIIILVWLIRKRNKHS